MFNDDFWAGLLSGEGSFTGDRNAPCVALKMHIRDRIMVEAFAERFGGSFFGPYLHGGRNYVIARINRRAALWAFCRFCDARLPACHKREQFEEWREKWRLPKSQP